MADASLLKRIVRNVGSSWLYLVAQAGASLFLTPYLITHLGDSGYGIITLIAGLVGYSGILYLGLGGAVVRYTAEHIAKGDKQALDETVSTIFTVYLVAGTFCLLLCGGVAYPLPSFFNVPPELVFEARLLILMTGITLFIEFPASVYSGFVQGTDRWDVINTRMFVVLVARVVATIVIIETSPSVLAIGAITTGAAIVEGIYTIVYVRRRHPEVRFTPKLFRKSRLKVLLSFSLLNMLLVVAFALTQYTDEAVISQAIGPALVTVYVIPLRLAEYARQGIYNAADTLVPSLTSAIAKGDLEHVRRLWRFTVKVAFALAMPIVTVLLLWGYDVVALWISPAHAEAGRLPMIFLSLAFFFHVQGRSITYPVMVAFNDLKPVAKLALVEAVANFALSVVLVRTALSIGGVGLGTMIPAFLIGFVALPWLVCRKIGVSFGAHMLDTFVRGLLPVPVIVGVLYAFRSIGFHESLPKIAVACLVVLLVHLALTGVLSFSKADRELVMARLRRR